LLEVFDRLDGDHVPFRLGVSLSPVLCHMLADPFLLDRYLQYIDRRIEFGERQIEMLPANHELRETVMYYYNRFLDQRVQFTERYNKDILKVFDYYQRKGRIELLTTAATHVFLPFYAPYPEAVQAQMEVAIGTYRVHFEKFPQGFWLPEMGWSCELEPWFRSYNFAYTLLDTHALAFASPPAEKGSFYPARTGSGFFLLGRDFYAKEDIHQMADYPAYRNNHQDLGYELPQDQVKAFLNILGGRTRTGYKCLNLGGTVYKPEEAVNRAKEQAREFLKNRITRLTQAKELMDYPISLCAFDAQTLGTRWYEGPRFLEAVFREGIAGGGFNFMTPAEYIFKLDPLTFQTLRPEYSSWGPNGYAESWVDSTNDWIYCHSMRAIERMIELAERFPDNTGLKERALNQAAREILLAQASDWPGMLYRQESTEYARNQLESALRNFTTIYEALGSNHISTEWLTNLERRHNIFPNINYRVFRRKK
jgi:1,4-alpha-glucan branching enzyme